MIQQRRHLPELRILQTFECAARHGNFTRAGEELSLTQSAVSRQIRELEEQLGKQVFERIRGRVVLTQSGESLLVETALLLQMAETTMRHATAGAKGERVLAINALPTFAARWLLPRLPGFLSRHPELRLDVSTRRDVFDFGQAQCDLAIHYGQPLWPGGSCTYLCSEVVVPVAGGALRDRPLASAADLADAPKVHLTERPHLWSDWFRRLDLDLANANEGHWFEQFSLTIEAVKGGLGYALLPLYLIEAELERGELKVMFDIPHSTDTAYYVVVPDGRDTAVADFCDWLRAQVR